MLHLGDNELRYFKVVAVSVRLQNHLLKIPERNMWRRSRLQRRNASGGGVTLRVKARKAVRSEVRPMAGEPLVHGGRSIGVGKES